MSAEPGGALLDDLLAAMVRDGASDLHLAAERAPRYRRHGRLVGVPEQATLGDAALTEMLRAVCPPERWVEFSADRDVDFAVERAGIGRFRANYLRREGGVGAVFRVVPDEIRALESLGLPPAVERLAELERGLVLVTGPTGSGKSTTLASILDRVNRTSARHIVTIEDPIEFIHRSARGVVSQRQVGQHARNFADALRGAMRQDADVILVGELRDPETISLALTAAEMGALVFGTLHTNSAVRTIDRIVDAFPPDEQAQARGSLANTLEAVLAQILVPTADGAGRCVAVELLLRSPGLPNIIREGKTSLLTSTMQSGRRAGMQSLDDALFALAKSGRVLGEDAYRRAMDKARFVDFI